MKAFVLAAGFGTRLKPLTLTTPKPLVAVNGIPLVLYTLSLLKSHGITDVVLNLHHLGEKIEQALQNGKTFGMNIEYIYENPILGTGGGIANVLSKMSDEFLVINSDLVTDLDLQNLISQHRASQNLATLAVKESEQVEKFGVLTFQNQKITSILAKSPPNGHQKSHFTGIHMISRQKLQNFLEKVTLPKTFCIIRDVYIPYLEENPESLGAFLHQGYWNDCGTFESLTQAEDVLKKGKRLSYQSTLENLIDLFTKI